MRTLRSPVSGGRLQRSRLVPISEPSTVDWPGPWLALLRVSDGDELVGAVAFGAPPGLAWHPLGGPETFEAVERGHLVAPADIALWSRRPPRLPAVSAASRRSWSRHGRKRR